MGGNVLAYALNKGTPTGSTIAGASGALTGSVLRVLFNRNDQTDTDPPKPAPTPAKPEH